METVYIQVYPEKSNWVITHREMSPVRYDGTALSLLTSILVYFDRVEDLDDPAPDINLNLVDITMLNQVESLLNGVRITIL